MSLGSFLGGAGLALPSYEEGLNRGRRMYNAQLDQQALNRSRRAVDELSSLDANQAGGVAPVIQPAADTPAPIAAPTPTPTPTPTPAAPPTAPPAAQGTTNIPSGSPLATGDLTALANPQTTTYGQPPPARPATVLTQAQADQANRWLTSADARTFFTNNPGEADKLRADPAKWVQDVLIPGRMPGLFAGTRADPIYTARTAQGTGAAPPQQGLADWITQGAVAGMTGVGSPPVLPGNEGPNKVARVDQTQRALAKSLGTVGGALLREAQQFAVPATTQPPTTPLSPVVTNAPASPAPMAQGAAQQVAQGKPPTAWYMANPNAITPDVQNALKVRQYLAQKAAILARARTPQALQAADEVIGQIQKADEQIAGLQGMQGIVELTTFNDPRRLAGYLSYKTGQPVTIVPRSDGTWNMMATGADGKQHIVAEGKTSTELADSAHALIDAQWAEKQREAAIAAAAKTTDWEREVFKSGLGYQSAENIARIQSNTTLMNAMITAVGAQGLERLKASLARNVWTSPTGDQFLNVGGQMFHFVENKLLDANGNEITSKQLVDALAHDGFVPQQGGAGLATPSTFP